MPERTCIGCRAVAKASDLVRVTVEGDLVRVAFATGRGAWLHPTRDCVTSAVEKKAFARAFRRAVRVPDVRELFGSVEEAHDNDRKRIRT